LLEDGELFGSIGVVVPEAFCSNVSGRASATEWLRFGALVCEEDVAVDGALSAFPGSSDGGVVVAIAATVLVPTGPAGMAASATEL